VMTRPDGVLIAVVIGCWLVLGKLRGQGSWRALGTCLGGVLLLTVPWTAWRLAYYGELVPNAVAAKSGAGFGWQLSEGWYYFLGFALAAAALLVAAVVAAYWLATRPGRATTARPAVWLLFTLAVTQFVFFVVIGGDWMPGWRFFAPAMPLLATGVSVVLVLVAAQTVQSPARGRVAPLLAVAISLPLLVMSVWDPRMRPAIAAWHTQVRELSATGNWIRRTVPAGTVISTFANGALSYAAGPGITVVDQLGLTDAHIALHGKRRARGTVGHLAYDYDYLVNTRRPAIVFVTGSGFYREPTCAILPAFRRHYVAVSFRDTANGLWALAYLRRGHAPALARRLGTDPTFRQSPCPHPAIRP
jgi:arabinofuranosyltransferase